MRILSALAIILMPLLSQTPVAAADPVKRVVQPVATQTNQPTIVRHIRLKMHNSQVTFGN